MLSTDCEYEVKNETFIFDYQCKSTSTSSCHGCYVDFVPGIYKFQLFGASGARGEVGIGGYGGYSEGFYRIKRVKRLFLFIGGTGTYSENETIALGGFNGGGNGSIGTENRSVGGGGGASDIRTTLNSSTRIIVAAGGGGGGGHDEADQSGGSGGGLSGSYSQSGRYNFANCAPPGTQEGPGIGIISPYGIGGVGSGTYDGIGGNSNISLCKTDSCGGGGGGYYGGSAGYYCGGGGGSSYIKGVRSYLGKDPFTVSGEITKYTGNGRINITFVKELFAYCTKPTDRNKNITIIIYIIIIISK